MKKHIKYVLYAFVFMVFLAGVIFSFYYPFKSNSKPWYFTNMNIPDSSYDGNIIAIIDSGYMGNIGFNEDCIIKKYNAIDDSQNVEDENGHGSAMLSLLIGYKNETIYIKGINSKAKIIIVKAVDENGKASVNSIVKGIRYSVENGANIINISLGTRINNQLLENAVADAINSGVYVVASMGDMELTNALYPANYDNVFAVQAQAKDGTKYIFANEKQGDYIRVPGVEITVLSYDNVNKKITTDQQSGSSIGTIIFTGMLSLIDFTKYKINYDYLYHMNKNQYLNYEKLRGEI